MRKSFSQARSYRICMFQNARDSLINEVRERTGGLPHDHCELQRHPKTPKLDIERISK